MSRGQDVSRYQEKYKTEKHAHNGEDLHAHVGWVMLPSQDGSHDRQASQSAPRVSTIQNEEITGKRKAYEIAITPW